MRGRMGPVGSPILLVNEIFKTVSLWPKEPLQDIRFLVTVNFNQVMLEWLSNASHSSLDSSQTVWTEIILKRHCLNNLFEKKIKGNRQKCGREASPSLLQIVYMTDNCLDDSFVQPTILAQRLSLQFAWVWNSLLDLSTGGAVVTKHRADQCSLAKVLGWSLDLPSVPEEDGNRYWLS